eukprot:5247421-Amphidinium_carterae.2
MPESARRVQRDHSGLKGSLRLERSRQAITLEPRRNCLNCRGLFLCYWWGICSWSTRVLRPHLRMHLALMEDATLQGVPQHKDSVYECPGKKQDAQ